MDTGITAARSTPAHRSHVVLVNWRDSRHPQAGGAELYCESVARRLAGSGHRVTLLTCRPAGAPRTEEVDGFTVKRFGGTLGVYPAVLAWLLRNRRRVDAVIDCQNGIPFFTPLVVPRATPVVCLIHHVHQDQFATYFRWPMDRVGRWLEGPVSRAVYGNRAIAAVSPSTRSDIRRRLRLRGRVHVVPCGAEVAAPEPFDFGIRRSRQPHIVCVGRLVPHKRMDRLIGAIPEIAAAHPDLTVAVVGSGPELGALRRQASDLGLDRRVVFHGQVSNSRREQLLEEAWLTVNPSAGEGWGLSVIEANAVGVPAIAYRVAGLRDSIVHGRTGWLVDPSQSLAPAVSDALGQLADMRAAAVWSLRAREWAQSFSWDTTTARLLDLIAEEQMRLGRENRGGEMRQQSDVACHVSVPSAAIAADELESKSRRTDFWVRLGDRLEALMPETDEVGVELAMARLGLEDCAEIRVARPADWLLGGVPIQ